MPTPQRYAAVGKPMSVTRPFQVAAADAQAQKEAAMAKMLHEQSQQLAAERQKLAMERQRTEQQKAMLARQQMQMQRERELRLV